MLSLGLPWLLEVEQRAVKPPLPLCHCRQRRLLFRGRRNWNTKCMYTLLLPVPSTSSFAVAWHNNVNYKYCTSQVNRCEHQWRASFYHYYLYHYSLRVYHYSTSSNSFLSHIRILSGVFLGCFLVLIGLLIPSPSFERIDETYVTFVF